MANEDEFSFSFDNIDDILKEAAEIPSYKKRAPEEKSADAPLRRNTPAVTAPVLHRNLSEDGNIRRKTSAEMPPRHREDTSESVPRTASRKEKLATKKEQKAQKKQREKEEKERIREEKEYEQERRRRIRAKKRRIRRKKFRKFLLIVLILAALAAAAAVYLGARIKKNGRNYPGVMIEGIDVADLTYEETVNVLNAAQWTEKASEPLKVTTFGGITFEVEPLRSGLVEDAEIMAEKANAYGRSESLPQSLLLYAKGHFTPVDIESSAETPDEEYLKECISAAVTELQEHMSGDEYVVDAQSGKLLMKKGGEGLTVNIDDLMREIIDVLKRGERTLEYTVPASPVAEPDFAAIHKELEREPADAYYSNDGKFEVTDEVVGCKFNVEEAQQIWDSAQLGDEVVIPIDVTFPEVTGDLLRSRICGEMLGAMTTRYTNSGENRCSNVRLAASKINGLVMYPGDEFSYNEVVGTRTKEAGFLPAPAYAGVGADGVKDEIGGGACQVSSTLYAATVFAFLETVERHNHVYPVNYIQLGTDATVTIPEDGGNVMDFKFRNNRNYPIKIIGYVNETDEEKSITFEIWGTLEDSDYMPVEFDNSWSWTFDYDRFIQPSHTDRPGYKIKLTHETWSFQDAIGIGARTVTHREVYDGAGNLVEDEILNPMISTGPAMDTYYNHQ